MYVKINKPFHCYLLSKTGKLVKHQNSLAKLLLCLGSKLIFSKSSSFFAKLDITAPETHSSSPYFSKGFQLTCAK